MQSAAVAASAPDDAAELIADQGHDQEVRARRGVGDREEIGELLLGEPVVDLDDLPMQLRHRGVDAADRNEGEKHELQEEGGKRAVVPHLALHQKTATLTGASKTTTQ